MTTKTLSFKTLPPLSVAEGDTSPNPGESGIWVWSTTLNRPMYWNGTIWTAGLEITVGTTAPASPVLNQLWVDTN